MAGRNRKGQFTKGGGRRSSSSTRSAPRRASSTKVITVRAAAPIAKRSHGGVRRRRSSGGGKIGGLLSTSKGSRGALALGALLLGYASKEGWLAKLPLIGKAGPITSAALLGFGAEEFLHVKLPGIVHDAVTAGLVLSAFNIGFSGGTTIVGDDASPGGAVFFD